MKLILWWSFASLLQVSEVYFCICFGVAQQQKTLQTMLLFAACMPGLSGHDRCSFFMFLSHCVSLLQLQLSDFVADVGKPVLNERARSHVGG